MNEHYFIVKVTSELPMTRETAQTFLESVLSLEAEYCPDTPEGLTHEELLEYFYREDIKRGKVTYQICLTDED